MICPVDGLRVALGSGFFLLNDRAAPAGVTFGGGSGLMGIESAHERTGGRAGVRG